MSYAQTLKRLESAMLLRSPETVEVTFKDGSSARQTLDAAIDHLRAGAVCCINCKLSRKEAEIFKENNYADLQALMLNQSDEDPHRMKSQMRMIYCTQPFIILHQGEALKHPDGRSSLKPLYDDAGEIVINPDEYAQKKGAGFLIVRDYVPPKWVDAGGGKMQVIY